MAGINDLSEEAVEALFARRVEPVAILATIQADGLDDPLRLSSSPDGRTSTGRAGIISRGDDYEFFPFEFAFSGAGKGEPTRDARIVIANRSGELAEALEGVDGQPVLTLEMVRTSAPDDVERAMAGAQLVEHEEEAAQITATLKPRRFDVEPACAVSYLPCRTPAMF